MNIKKIRLSDGEWKLMHLLWNDAPQTIAALVAALKNDTAWTKHTIFVMLSRMAAKGAVYAEEGGRSKHFYPALSREEAAALETESFLDKVYGGSLGMMVNAMAGRNALSQEDIDELYALLAKAERGEEK